MNKKHRSLIIILAIMIFALFSAGNVFAADNYTPSGINGKNWMHYIPDYASIAQINVPGSHDAATDSLKLIGAKHWLKTQNKSIKEQLDFGVRLLDIRIDASNKKDDMIICHGPADCYRSKFERYYFSALISDCKTFLKDNSSETILMSVQQETDSREAHQDKYDKLWARYLKSFESDDKIIYLDEHSIIPSLGECRGKIVIFLSDCLKKTEDHDTVKESKKIEYLEKIWKKSHTLQYEDRSEFYKSAKDDDYTSIPLVVFSSCRDGDKGKPSSSYEKVHKFIMGKYSADQYKLQQGNYYGWCFNNFSNKDLSQAYYMTNQFVDPQKQDNSRIYWGCDGKVLTFSSKETIGTPNSFYKHTRFWSAQVVPWLLYRNITEVHSLDTISPYYLDNWFVNFKYLERVDADIDSSNLVSMNKTFSGCMALQYVVNRKFVDTSKLKECNETFLNDGNLKSIYVGGEDVSFVSAAKSSQKVFDNCKALKGSCGTTVSTVSDSRDLARVDSSITAKRGVLSYLDPSTVYWGVNGSKLTISNYCTDDTPTELSYNGDYPNWSEYKEKIKSVVVTDEIIPTTTNSWFRGMKNAVDFDLELLDTKNVTSMWGMFDECTSVRELDLSSFSSAALTNADYMFYNCTRLETIYADEAFVLPAVKINDSYQAFFNCTSLVGGEYTKFDQSYINGERGRVDRALRGEDAKKPGYFSDPVRFYWGVDGNILYLSTVKQDKTSNEFKDRYTTWTQPWDRFNSSITKVEILNKMFPKYMCCWFMNLKNVTQIDLSKIDTSNTVSMYRCFFGSGIRSLDIRNFVCDRLQDVNECFAYMSNLTRIYANSEFDLRGLSECGHLFADDRNLRGGMGTENVGLAESDKDVSLAVCDGKDGGKGLFTEKNRTVDNIMYWGINGNVLYLDNKKTEICQESLYDNLWIYINAPWYSHRKEIKKVTVLNTISPRYTYAWFYGFDAATEFDLLKLDTSNTVDMSEMFYGVKSCETLDISRFKNTALKSAKDMFSECVKLKTIYADKDFDLRGIDNVRMFEGCRSLVGGNGTSYRDIGKISSNYAVCDSTEHKGYFTENCEFYWGIENHSMGEKALYLSAGYSDNTPNLEKSRPYTEEKRAPWSDDAESITLVRVLDKVSLRYLDGLFENLKNATYFELENLDITRAKSMSRMFKNCQSVETLNLQYFVNGWLTSADEMFAGCTKLETIHANPHFYLTYPDELSAEGIFNNCTSLEGGEGTKFDSAKQKERACVDNPPIEEGYFTYKLPDMEDGVDVKGFAGNYDGQPHMIEVELSGKAIGASVYYSLSEDEYGSYIPPEIIDEGEYEIYYRVVKYGYEDVTGMKKVIINPLEFTDEDIVITPQPEIAYDGEYHTFNVTLNGAAKDAYLDYDCSTSPEDYEMIDNQIMPLWSKTGEYDITVIVVKDHYREYKKTTKLVIAPKRFDDGDITAASFSGEYDGKNHTINVTLQGSAEDALVYYAEDDSEEYSLTPVCYRDYDVEKPTKTVKYKVCKENYEDYYNKATVEIRQKELTDDNLILQKSEYVMPSGGGSIEVLYRVVCGNALLIKGTDYEVTSGETGESKGYYELKLEGKGNYCGEINAGWKIVEKSLNDYLSVENFNGEYDGNEQMASVNVDPLFESTYSSPINLSYAEFPNGTFGSDMPKYRDAGVHVIRYKATTDEEDFEDVEGTVVVEITPKELTNNELGISPETFVYNEEEHTTDYAVKSPFDASVNLVEGNDYEIITAVTSAVDVGEYPIVVNGIGNYSGEAVKVWSITNGDMRAGVTAAGYTGEYDKKGHEITIELRDAAVGANVRYRKDDSSYSYENPQFTQVGTYTVYYIVSKKGYEEVKGSETVTINPISLKEDNVLVLSSYNVYSGNEIEPEIFVYYNNKELNRNIDYEVTGDTTGTEVGSYCLTVSGKGDFGGSVDVKWKIAGEDDPIDYDLYSGEYDGLPHASYVIVPDYLKDSVTVTYGPSMEECNSPTPEMQTDAGMFMYWTKVVFNDGSLSPYKTQLFGVIKPRLVTATADNKSKYKGENDPALTYSVDRLLEGDSIGDVELFRDFGEEVGEYVINVEADPEPNNNYYVLTQNGTFTIREPKKDDPKKDDPEKPKKHLHWIGDPFASDAGNSNNSSDSSSSGQSVYTVSFDTNGGYYVNQISVTEGQTIDFSGITTFKANAKFTGWYLDKELKNKVVQLQIIGNTTLYAGWEQNIHTAKTASKVNESSGASIGKNSAKTVTGEQAEDDEEDEEDDDEIWDEDVEDDSDVKEEKPAKKRKKTAAPVTNEEESVPEVKDVVNSITPTPVAEATDDASIPLPLKICIALGGTVAAGGAGFLIWKKKRS